MFSGDAACEGTHKERTLSLQTGSRTVRRGPQFYSAREVARFLGVSVRTVHQRIHDGRIAARLDGRVWRISGDDLWTHIDAMPPAFKTEFTTHQKGTDQ